MYKALYRKLRPVTFNDVIGQDHITTTLKNQVQNGKPSHAYMFFGSRGTGKTSCSKILAKAVNCPDQQDGNPCGVCGICKGIDNDSILDVTEIDAASNSGVDNIRELREEAFFLPVVTKYRVYIIDETHMLSTGAFNALLKIMEEPPEHVIFILATTEIHKVPATILSRCQRYDFHRIPTATLSDYLLTVAKNEGAQLADDAAFLIARLADGAARDALSLLDLCLSLEDHVNLEKVQEIAGLSDNSFLYDTAKHIAENNYMAALELLNQLWRKSIDPVQYCGQLLSLYRDLLVVKSAGKASDLLGASGFDYSELEACAKLYSIERLFYSIQVLSDTLGRLSQAANRKSEFEIALLKLSNMSVNTQPAAVVARLEALEQKLKHGIPVSSTPPPPIITDKPDQPPEDTPRKPKPEAVLNDPVLTATLFADWADVLDVLKEKNAPLFGSLINSTAYVSGDFLLVDAGSDLFTNMMRTDDYAKNSLRESAMVITGKNFKLGPYEPDKYNIAADDEGSNMLDDILKSAQDLGVDVEIND